MSKTLFLDFKISNDCKTECTIDIFSYKNLKTAIYSVNFHDCNTYHDTLMVGNVFVLVFSHEIKFFEFREKDPQNMREQPQITHITNVTKTIGYTVFEGYRKDQFLFLDRDQKDEIVLIQVNKKD